MQRKKQAGNVGQDVGQPVEKEKRCWGRSRCGQGQRRRARGSVQGGGGGCCLVQVSYRTWES